MLFKRSFKEIKDQWLFGNLTKTGIVCKRDSKLYTNPCTNYVVHLFLIDFKNYLHCLKLKQLISLILQFLERLLQDEDLDIDIQKGEMMRARENIGQVLLKNSGNCLAIR